MYKKLDAKIPGGVMIKNIKQNALFCLFLFCVVAISCDNNLVNYGNNEKKNAGTTVPDDNTGDSGTGIPITDHLRSLRGTRWNANTGSLIIEFTSTQILFRNRQNFGSIGGNLNTTVTHGNFRISSYDGTTMRILDYDNMEVTFTVIISENQMVLNGLNAIRWTAPPFERRNFSQWNSAYTRVE